MHTIAVIGTGYVGLVTGACLSDFGLNVVCADIDSAKIEKLKKGEIPIYEPGLEAIAQRTTYYKRLSFTTDVEGAVREASVVFIAVGTPSAEDGSADLKYVEAAARTIARSLCGYKVVVTKSTVPVGTGRRVKGWIRDELEKSGRACEFDVVSNPEFLREGSAVYDFTHPDRIVIGCDSPRALETMKQVYRVLYLNDTPFVETGIETAEMIKYASNSFLAVKITFINEMANLCEKLGANVQDVARAMGKDGRIGPKFLHAGPGYGGSCFPKDTRALAELAKKADVPLGIVEAAICANERQKLLMAEKIASRLGTLEGKTLAVLGLAFKPNTDDMREAPALTIMGELARRGARFRAYDPAAMEEAKWRLADIAGAVTYCAGEYEAIHGADALVLLTEWNQFRNLDLDRIKAELAEGFFFDFRNIYKKELVENSGLTYIGVGV
ncbi:MAG: UDP-glucose/GDP-mannose dehydrogenase family protein [Spirochaetia bacterium]|jgi:UDPglucose 6-dehydrogenase|nr:UDP-glucose/GDP-mannose dehydrogenase family protein [Spirochaetia bacterium]